MRGPFAMERLAKSDPGNVSSQARSVANLMRSSRPACLKAGETAKAARSPRSGRQIAARLPETYPDEAEWKEGVAWFDRQIAALPH